MGVDVFGGVAPFGDGGNGQVVAARRAVAACPDAGDAGTARTGHADLAAIQGQGVGHAVQALADCAEHLVGPEAEAVVGEVQTAIGINGGIGELDLDHLPEDNEEAIALLTKVKGIGRWSAEIYLLFAEGRPDVWPAGDLAVQIEIGRLMGLEMRPGETLTRELAEAWRPYRGALAILTWHHYGAGMDAAPI